ncbi:hypothetical protein CNMCM6936_005872 [Aspergillus lentulus]|nr:hypothetical protein CNMCM6069_006634 [Aspergillus lentulus]KAF4166963.1 hypothetical protein CNMCM6936_005872 [Aspergillus lentulus]
MHPSISNRYGESPPRYEEVMSGQYLEASTSAREDGRIDVTVKVKQPGLESLLPDNRSADSPRLPEVPLSAVKPLNTVMQIVGSTGTRLRKDGHRIRLATHENLKDFIRDSGLEFFPIGGNPEGLMI